MSISIRSTLYPHINNDIEYGLFKDVINSYYLDSQIKDNFACDQNCHTNIQHEQHDQILMPCTHTYNHIIQHVNNLDDPIQQHTVYSKCPYDIVLGQTSLAQLSAWQDYASRQLFIQQISIPLIATNNIRVLPGHTGIISLVLKPSETSFTPCHMIVGKGIAYVKPFDSTLPLRPVEIEFENNRCCLEV